MTRSLFLSYFFRFLLACLLVAIACSVLGERWWWVKAIFIAAVAFAFAGVEVRSFRRMLRPVAASASLLTAGSISAVAVEYDELNQLAYLLSEASLDVERMLRRADESRRELEALLDSMQDAVVAVDAGGRIQWANEKMRRLRIGDPVSGSVRVGHALVQTVRDPDVLDCVREVLEARTVCERRSFSLLPGSIFAVSAAPMPDGGAVAVLHDITRIEEVERTQKDFVANVSHELRTPLTSISGYVETLLDHEASLSAQAREFLKTILKNAGRMHRLTEDLLVLAKVESSEEEMRLVPVRADALVQDAVTATSGIVQDSNAVLEMNVVTGREVLADTDAIVQVLSNLIENAIKYGHSRNDLPPRVVVSAETSLEHPLYVLFQVRDFGSGIASEHLGRIFERFYRVDKARSREMGGTGLGLAIAQHIVHAHGGTIWATSELNQGSTFSFTLPERQESH